MFSGELEYRLRSNPNKFVRYFFDRWSEFRNKIFVLIAKILNITLCLLPTRFKVILKEHINVKIKMPYPELVKLEVDTYRELRRAAFCYREPETLAWVEECAKKGGVFFDVGANIGAVSLLYAANVKKFHGTIPSGSIYSFEPTQSTYTRLCKNILSNDWSEAMIPVSLPLSNKLAPCIFSLTNLDSGSSGHSVTSIGSKNKKLQLPTMSLTVDYMVKEFGFPAPRFIKIDVDGHDFEVLMGCDDVLKQGMIKSVLIEKNSKENEIRTFLSQFGFRESVLVSAKRDLNLRFDRD